MNQQHVQAFNQKVDGIEMALSGFVDHGTDHELFLSGYLHGHFSLVVSQAEIDTDMALEGLDNRMKKSLAEAFEQGELEPVDQQLALDMWQSLFDKS